MACKCEELLISANFNTDGKTMVTRWRLSRRTLLRMAAPAGIAVIGSPFIIARSPGQQAMSRAGDPFSLGVASGAPKSDGFVIWTRLAPDPLSSDPETPGGMHGEPVQVIYEIAADDRMQKVLRSGTVTARTDEAFAVHLEIGGLESARSYWYRFRTGAAESRVGRAITLPREETLVNSLRFGFVCCSNYEAGYFSAYRLLADEHPDLVLFLGDYIYEDVDRRPDVLRKHSDGIAATTLTGYRNRYAQYRLDPDLQRLHAEVPALMVWDDHEVQNDYADRWSQTFDDPQRFLERRAAAYQAYFEHMPLHPGLSRPSGAAMRIFNRVSFGDLAEFSLLDGRQYRSRAACYGPPDKGSNHLENGRTCPELLDVQRSIIGAEQEAWLFQGLSRSKCQWNILAQDVLMARLRQRTSENEFAYGTDRWDGYPESRNRLLRHLHDGKVKNPVVLGGDLHSFCANELLLNFDDEKSPVVATELIGTSVSSPGPDYEQFRKLLAENPHIKYFDSRQRGYVSVDVFRKRMDIRFRAISNVLDAQATAFTLEKFGIENGLMGAIRG
jgi:alkaline phosphatase D